MTISKLALIATAALGLGVTAVQAQDSVDWNGFYAGVFGGGTAGNGQYVANFFDGVGFVEMFTDADISGLFGGVALGVNYQLQQGIVVGAEADIAAASISGTNFLGGPGFPISGDINATASLRGRVGFAVDRFLPFATAGIALAHTAQSIPFPLDEFLQDGMLLGWTIGAGAEYAVTDAISVKAEYRYSQYKGSQATPFFFPGDGSDAKTTFATHDVRLGLNYRF